MPDLAPPQPVPLGDEDLACPLCHYNLRGLIEPRCPECGFRFTWDELRDEQRDHHRYLFEHARRQRFRAFWQTYWRNGRPRRFWRDVSPANPVRLGRLILYWALANGPLILAPIVIFTVTFVGHLHDQRAERARWRPDPASPRRFFITYAIGFTDYASASDLRAMYPSPVSRDFLSQVWTDGWGSYRPSVYGSALIIILWPALTYIGLLLFRASMRRAQVDRRHVLRAVIYSCDFSLTLAIVVVMMIIAIQMNIGDVRGWLRDRPVHAAAPLAGVVLCCAAVTTYRLGLAYARYLRFDRPFLTVASVQAIVVLLFAVALTRFVLAP